MPGPGRTKLISLIAPAYNESAVVRVFYTHTRDILQDRLPGYEWEIIFVDDGSTDDTLQILKSLRREDPRVKWLALSRNFGHQAALTAGLERASGDAVITMDCDLQHPASLLPEMVKQWEEGFEVVQAIRREDPRTGIFKRLTSGAFYRIINRLSATPVRPNSADFRLLSRNALRAFLRFREVHRFIRGMVSWMGFRTCEVSYLPEERHAGKSKYTLRKMLNFALDGLTSFSIIPLRISAVLGIIIFFGALFYALYAVVVWFIHPQNLQVGWTSILVTLNLLGGTILLFLGIVGEYIGRIYEQVKMRPLYFIGDAEGFSGEGNRTDE